jgi:hypothetical protein
MLSRLSPVDQAREFDFSLDYFREKLGLEVGTLSYPYGIQGSWNQHTKKLAEAHGITAGLTLGRQVYEPEIHQDHFEIPRYDVNDVFDQSGFLKSDLLP